MTTVAFAALWAFVFAIPFETQVLSPEIGTLNKLLGALALGLALVTFVMKGRFRRWHMLHVGAVLFVIWAGAILLIENSGQKLPHKYFEFTQLFAVIWMVWELAPSRSRLLWLLFAYVLGTYVATGETLMVFARSHSLRRFTYEGRNENDLAMGLAVAIPMAWYLASIFRRPALQWAARATLPLCILVIALTGSRGGMITAMFALLIVPLSMTKLTAGRLAAAISMLAIAGGLAVKYVPDTVAARLATTGQSVQNLTLGGRFRIWQAGWQAFSERPMIGHGTSSFRSSIAPYIGNARIQVAHNSFLSVVVEEGLIGLAFYLTMFGAAFSAFMKLPKPDRRFAQVLYGTLLLSMVSLSSEESPRVWFVLAVLVGLARAHALAVSGEARDWQVAQKVTRRYPSAPGREEVSEETGTAHVQVAAS
jgi:O-antigen ligase